VRFIKYIFYNGAIGLSIEFRKNSESPQSTYMWILTSARSLL
jgi:hypothetical protein